jgi:hypothetical protein
LFMILAACVPIQHATLIATVFLAGTILIALVQPLLSVYTKGDAAQVADLVLDTHSLFVTAHELHSAHPQHECVHRAAKVAADVDLAQVVPIRTATLWLGLASVLVAAALIPWLPRAVAEPPGVPEVSRQIAADRLDDAADRIDEAGDPKAADRAKRLRRLARRLREDDINRRAAMEELGELKRQLRAESRTDQLRALRGLQSAGRSLSQSDLTRQLGHSLGQSRSSSPASEGERTRDALRELAKLDRQAREEAAESLEHAAERARAEGNEELADALQAAANALRNGSPAEVDAAANLLAQAARNARGPQGEPGRGLANDLERAQAALDGRPANINPLREAAIAPEGRDWSKSGQGSVQGAGFGHTDEEQSDGETSGEHQDSDRFGENSPDRWTEEYRDLYEAALLNSDGRIATKVSGERRREGKVQVIQGGQQQPRAERARDVIAKLPVRYADEAREAVSGESVPPGYRDAVREYFDAERR